MKRILLLFTVLLTLATGWAGYQWADIMRIWHRETPVQSDVAIVLGAAVWNGRPSPALRERLDVAFDLYQAGLVPAIICTGGFGAEERSEAAVCAAYLQSRGVDPGALVIEDQSATTWQNLVNARALMRERQMESVVIVTHGFHLKRALLQARDLGMRATGAPVQIRPLNLTYLTLREIAGITYYLLGGRDPSGLGQSIRLDR